MTDRVTVPFFTSESPSSIQALCASPRGLPNTLALIDFFLSVTPQACSPFFQAPERNPACQHLSDFTSSVAMVMHIPAQTGEKVQLQVTMNMNEAQHSAQGEDGLS